MTRNKFYQYALAILQIITGILAGVVFVKELISNQNVFTMIVTILTTILGLTLGFNKLYHLHSKNMRGRSIKEYTYVTLREKAELKEAAATWFHEKWEVPQEDYLECMEAYLNYETEYGWYLCLDNECIVGGLGVIENDFHDRKDLAPNICAVYTEKEYRCQGIARHLLDFVVNDLKSKGITPVYLITDHIGFYEKYGWEFLCMVQGDNDSNLTRMYIHK